MRILLIGKKSFLAKNFIKKYKEKNKIFYFDSYFSDNYKNFLKKIYYYTCRKKINHIINFAGNNDNSLYPAEKNNILRDNFIFPISLVDLFKKKKINFTFFLSSEIDKIENKNKNNLYALSKFFLKDSLRFVANKNKISLIKIDNVYGPFDLNFKRLIPSLMLTLLIKKKMKINLKQNRKLIYVNDILPIIFNTLKNKKKINLITVKGSKINILSLWKNISKTLENKNRKKIKASNFYTFIETLNWYENNIPVLQKYSKRY